MTVSPATDRALARTLDKLVSRRNIGHAVVAIESGDGSLSWIGAAGDADGRGRAMTADTPFYLASVTKTYAAALVLRLHERGQLGLDEPITAYLPASITNRLHVWRGEDVTARITVRQLLANTSGLANYFEDRPKGGRSLAEQLFSDGDRSWTTQDVADMVRDQLRPHFAPGEGLRYCDTNFQLLEAIVEAVGGEPFHQLLATHVLQPLDLQQTYLAGHVPPDLDPPHAELFHAGQPLHLPRAMAAIGAQGALIATTADTFRFMRGLLAGRLFERPGTLELMQADWKRFGLPTDAAAIRAPSWPIQYGLGIMRFRLPRVLNMMRAMPAVVGHTGSSGSWLFHAPEVDLYLAGTVDEVTSGAVPYRLVPRLLNIVGRGVEGNHERAT